MRVKPIKEFNRILTPPPDKSITIRAIIMGMLARGETVINNPLISGDTVSAVNCAVSLGAEAQFYGGSLKIIGGHIKSAEVDAGNSATTLRLLVGALCGKNGNFTFTGDESLKKRKMTALIDALKLMGADIYSNNGFLPINVKGNDLRPIDFVPSVPSAQIKSAVLLAALNCDGITTVTEKIKTRTHTEDMLPLFGADVIKIGDTVSVKKSALKGAVINVPGDISSAAYPIAIALKKGFCYLKNVGTSRRELVDFLKSIGGDISVLSDASSSDIIVKKSMLRPFTISGALSAALIDELPLLAVLACTLNGKSVIKDAASLRNKECDRIKCTVSNLRNMGAKIDELNDGFVIYGGKLDGGSALSYGDHRMAMSMAVGNAVSCNGGTVDNEKCVEISYPSFWELFE